MPQTTNPVPPLTDAQQAHFWSRVNIGAPQTCWPWTGACNSKGYGTLKMGPRGGRVALRAHRLAWALRNNADPVGLLVCHECDNRACCNPQHLWLGTDHDNVRDMHSKGRARPGGGAKAHCVHGHPFDAKNTAYWGNPKRRYCKACRAAFDRRSALSREAA